MHHICFRYPLLFLMCFLIHQETQAQERQKLVEVPNLVRRKLEEARAILQEAQLQMVATPVSTHDHEPGTVIEQNQVAGTQVPVRTTVYLTVATTMELVEVPNLLGRKLEEASAILGETQLQLGPTEEEKTSEHLPGTVLRQDPIAGTQAPAQTLVRLVVALEEMVEVPNVVGRTLAEVGEILGETGLRLGLTDKEKTTEHKPGTVLRQSPVARTLVSVGTPVRLAVATRQAFALYLITVLAGTLLALIGGYTLLKAKKSKVVKDVTPAIQIRPQKDSGTQQIKAAVALSSNFEMRLRTKSDSGKQKIEVQDDLVIGERRNHE